MRKGKKAKPNEFGAIVQYAELTPNTRRGARGLLLPAKVGIGNPRENVPLPRTAAELTALGVRPMEAVFDQGSREGRRPRQWSRSKAPSSSSAAGATPAHGEPASAWPRIASAARAASLISNESTWPSVPD